MSWIKGKAIAVCKTICGWGLSLLLWVRDLLCKLLRCKCSGCKTQTATVQLPKVLIVVMAHCAGSKQ